MMAVVNGKILDEVDITVGDGEHTLISRELAYASLMLGSRIYAGGARSLVDPSLPRTRRILCSQPGVFSSSSSGRGASQTDRFSSVMPSYGILLNHYGGPVETLKHMTSGNVGIHRGATILQMITSGFPAVNASGQTTLGYKPKIEMAGEQRTVKLYKIPTAGFERQAYFYMSIESASNWMLDAIYSRYDARSSTTVHGGEFLCYTLCLIRPWETYVALAPMSGQGMSSAFISRVIGTDEDMLIRSSYFRSFRAVMRAHGLEASGHANIMIQSTDLGVVEGWLAEIAANLTTGAQSYGYGPEWTIQKNKLWHFVEDYYCVACMVIAKCNSEPTLPPPSRWRLKVAMITEEFLRGLVNQRGQQMEELSGRPTNLDRLDEVKAWSEAAVARMAHLGDS